MATLTATSFSPNSSTAVALTMAATSSNGDAFANNGGQVVLFQNSSSQGGASVTVTFTGQGVDNFGGAGSLHTITVPVASSSMLLYAVGPFRTAIFNDANGLVQMTYSAAGLFVKVVNMAPQS